MVALLPKSVLLLLVLQCLRLDSAAAAGDTALPRSQTQDKLGDSNFTCTALSFMLLKKDGILKTLEARIEEIRSQQAITTEQKLKMEILLLYRRELRAADKSFMTALRDLNATLSSDYKSLENIRRSCKVRLDDMRNAAVSVEEDFNSLQELEREVRSLHPNMSLQFHNSFIDEMLIEIYHAADDLESKLEEDIFRDSKNLKGAAFETVVKLKEGDLYDHGWIHMQKRLQESKRLTSNIEYEEVSISMLIDSSSNQYVLSRPRDLTMPMEDHHLIHDIISLLLLAFVLGSLCTLIKVPPLFGYIFSGLLLGPVGYNVVGAVVQVETIGEFGVIFIVFTVGLEFSPEKLQKVWRVSVYGGNLFLLSSLTLAVFLGSLLGVHPQHSLFVAASLALSSNALGMRFVGGSKHVRSPSDTDPTTHGSHTDSESDASGCIGGILVMQDIQLGMLMALMPFFMENSPRSSRKMSSLVLSGLLQVGQVVVCFCLLLIVSRGRALDRFCRLLNSVLNKTESFLLGSIALCFLFLLMAEMVGASLELGCFMAGLTISAQGHTIVGQVKKLILPVRDLFAVFFFASIGFHVFPTFLQSEFTMIFVVTFAVVFLKFFLALFLLGLFLGHCRWSTWVIALGLAPISEFSFVLASRARRLSIISREVYLIVLSIAALSLLLAPLVWQVLLLLRAIQRSTPHHSFVRLSQTASSYFGPGHSHGSPG